MNAIPTVISQYNNSGFIIAFRSIICRDAIEMSTGRRLSILPMAIWRKLRFVAIKIRCNIFICINLESFNKIILLQNVFKPKFPHLITNLYSSPLYSKLFVPNKHKRQNQINFLCNIHSVKLMFLVDLLFTFIDDKLHYMCV